MLKDLVPKIRSKNAGPFWLTIDVFCGTPEVYDQVKPALETAQVAAALGAPVQSMKRFDIPQLSVIKFSCPRPFIQGDLNDPDMHGASWAALLGEITVNTAER